MFGDFAEARGHGKYVKWVLEPLGWKVQPATVDGVARGRAGWRRQL